MMSIFRQAFCIIASSVLLSTGTAGEPARFEFESKHMGTQFQIIVYAEKAVAEQAAKAGFARVAELELVMSDYNPQSEIMRLCKQNDAEPGKPLVISNDLLRVLQAAQQTAKLSDGAFDVTVSPYVKLWRISRKTQILPDAADLAKAKALVGWEHLKLDATAKTLTLAKPGMRLDFGGIGKGFAADEVLKLLREKFHITSALVAGAGDITVSEAPPAKEGWSVEIMGLRKDEPRRKLLLKNASVSTSGDLEQVAFIGGVRYSHIVNPKTGLGLTGRRSVTVIAPSGTLADSLTKVGSVLETSVATEKLTAIRGVSYSITTQPSDSEPPKTVTSTEFNKYLQK
ncbi:MAG: FAD:protein FMN transferase [Fimbriiglobus sp.]